MYSVHLKEEETGVRRIQDRSSQVETQTWVVGMIPLFLSMYDDTLWKVLNLSEPFLICKMALPMVAISGAMQG